jgi:4-amino-4-deoxy-L-arabinose transferase-like glycosyltransferase
LNKKDPFLKKLSSKKTKLDYTIVFLWITIALVSIIRYRLIDIPFERDEGEYGYIGNLMLHGVAPFKDAYTMKLPGTSFMYAVFMLIFGHTSSGVHLGLLFINAATMYFLFNAFKKIFNSFIGISTATIYGFMSLATVFNGFAAHATHFICFYSSIGLLFLANYMKSSNFWRLFLCGLMFGIAFVMKQQAIFLIIFGAAFLSIYFKLEIKETLPGIFSKLMIYGLGIIIPYAIIILVVFYTGQFNVFLLWTIKYASNYEMVKSIAGDSMLTVISNFFKSTFFPAWDCFYYFWLLALAGILVLFWSTYSSIQKLFTVLYLIASACIFSAGFYFRQHYYIVVLPTLGLLIGTFIEFVVKQYLKWKITPRASIIPLIVLSFLLSFTIYNNWKYYFVDTPLKVCTTTYLGNPFDIAQEISKYIHANTNDTDKIAVLGSEPEFYFYTDRAAATGFLYTYPLVENQPYNEIMQEQMIYEIEKNKPKYIIVCNIFFSWMEQGGSPRTIFKWANLYTSNYYTPVGFANFSNDSNWRSIAS